MRNRPYPVLKCSSSTYERLDQWVGLDRRTAGLDLSFLGKRASILPQPRLGLPWEGCDGAGRVCQQLRRAKSLKVVNRPFPSRSHTGLALTKTVVETRPDKGSPSPSWTREARHPARRRAQTCPSPSAAPRSATADALPPARASVSKSP